jgi:hypothetical protein
VEAALRALRFQREAGELAGSLPPAVLATSYAGGVLTHFPEPRVDLYFVGDVPAPVADQVAESGLDDVQLHGGMKYNLAQMAERTSVVREAASRLGFQELTAGYRVANQQITVDLVQPDASPTIEGVALAEAISADVTAHGVEIDADDLQVVEHSAGTVLVESMHGYGGAGLRDDGVRECTSAFVVRRTSDGAEGPLVAAHCEGINRMEENNSSGGVNLTFTAPFVSEHIGTWGDVEWHTSGHDDFPQFWSSSSELRRVGWRATPFEYMENAYLCKYGRSGGTACGYITRPYTEIPVTWGECGCDIIARNMVEVRMERCCIPWVQGGDSGGPWFYATGAFGITSGGSGVDPRDGYQIAWFSRTEHAENAFGVRIQLG